MKVEQPRQPYLEAFYSKGSWPKAATRWLEDDEAKYIKRDIHHARCGHGGERWTAGHPVDDYCDETKMVYQYHGCDLHGL